MPKNSTIAAFATPSGTSALAVIRVSGQLVREIAEKAFGNKKPFPRRAVLGTYRALSGTALDDCVWVFYEAPASYTGEDALEISCHGNPFIFRRILEDLFRRGCRAAEPGEFTKRAFLNGKMDLSQAEAVADVIEADSERSFEAARKLLSGELGRRISAWNDEILALIAETETQIDFSDEEVPELDFERFSGRLHGLMAELEKTALSARYASKVHEGVGVVIFGAPNAGKSSLLNALLGSDRALVSEEAGTTRDFISEKFSAGPHCIRIIDTAGIRSDAASAIEIRGMERTRECMGKADFLIFVVDASVPPPALPADLLQTLNAERTLIVFNKNDKPPAFELSSFLPNFERISVSLLDVSSAGIITEKLSSLLEKKGVVPADDILVVSARHAEALRKAEKELSDALSSAGKVPIEFVSSKLRNALEELSEILGRFDNEKVLDRVFSSFCIGK